MAPTAPDSWTKVATSATSTEHMDVQQVVVVDDLRMSYSGDIVGIYGSRMFKIWIFFMMLGDTDASEMVTKPATIVV